MKLTNKQINAAKAAGLFIENTNEGYEISLSFEEDSKKRNLSGVNGQRFIERAIEFASTKNELIHLFTEKELCEMFADVHFVGQTKVFQYREVLVQEYKRAVNKMELESIYDKFSTTETHYESYEKLSSYTSLMLSIAKKYSREGWLK